ncbi:MAG: RsmB/NOP family class I SAM-dependent RNA methyltransferase [Pseudomonadota bacterium]
MQLAGRISAAIEILEDFQTRRIPLKIAIADWARQHRIAGAKDRAFISGICLDVLRKRNSLARFANGDDPRGLVLHGLARLWGVSPEELSAAAIEPHGPGALTDSEVTALRDSSECAELDVPDWTVDMFRRAFGADRARKAADALCARADIDLRLNTLKSSQEKTLAALKPVRAAPAPILATAARIAAPDPKERAPAVTVIPAFNKGWVEVQDLGSQIAAAAAGAIKGAQVLDFCAGGGGKSLALAAQMENTGQLYAYDIDPRRLRPLYARAKRAGVKNLQIRSKAGRDDDCLADLRQNMDVVFVDAPCTGSGTWRRHPDTKWRLTQKQLERRIAEQDLVLQEAVKFVKPGGRIVWVTCSVFMEENEDRLAAFLQERPEFAQTKVADHLTASGLLRDDPLELLGKCQTNDGALRLAPDLFRTDGFFVATLERTL